MFLRARLFSKYGGGPLHFSAEGDGGGGGGGQTDSSNAAALTALEARYGSARAALTVLYDENYRHRERNRTLRKQLDAAKLQEGAIVLTKEEAEFYAAVKELKLSAADLTKALSERTELQGKMLELERDKVRAEAATTLQYRPAVLSDLLRGRNMVLEMRDVEVEKDGNKSTKRLPYVKHADAAADKFELLEGYVTAHLKDYLPSLKAEAADGGDKGLGNSIEFPEQPSTGKVPSQKDVVGNVLGNYVTPSKRD